LGNFVHTNEGPDIKFHGKRGGGDGIGERRGDGGGHTTQNVGDKSRWQGKGGGCKTAAKGKLLRGGEKNTTRGRKKGRANSWFLFKPKVFRTMLRGEKRVVGRRKHPGAKILGENTKVEEKAKNLQTVSSGEKKARTWDNPGLATREETTIRQRGGREHRGQYRIRGGRPEGGGGLRGIKKKMVQ